MKNITVKIIDPIGIHARPASAIVNATTKFASAISFKLDGRVANAKSIINLMALGAKKDSKIEIVANGADEDQAISKIEEVLKSEKLI